MASLGFLCRGLNFGRAAASRRAMEFYTPLFRSMAEFMAAYYMASVASYANILRRDLLLLPGLGAAGAAGASAAGPTETVLLFLLGLPGAPATCLLRRPRTQKSRTPPPPASC